MRDICFSNSADLAMRVAACSISLAAFSRNFSASRQSYSEVDFSGIGFQNTIRIVTRRGLSET